MSIDVLAGLLDEKLIRILSLFLKSPDKTFSLTEVSRLSRVNNATTFRTLNKLVSEELIRVIIVGKVRTYQLSNSDRVISLNKLLRIEDKVDQVKNFCDMASKIDKIKIIILDSKEAKKAKVIVVSESSCKDKIKEIIENIKKNHDFHIDFVELTTTQYSGLKETSMFDQNKKILYASK